MFSLLFTNGKISSFEQLKDNFDIEAVKLYYLGGSLTDWLEMCGKSEIAQKVRNIDLNRDIDVQLADIFGQPIPVKARIERAEKLDRVKKSLTSFVLEDNPLKYALSANKRSFMQILELRELSEVVKSDSFSVNGSSFYSLSGSFEFKPGSFEYKTGSFGYGVGSFSYEYESEYEKGSFVFERNSFSAAAGSHTLFNTSFLFGATSFGFNKTSFSFNQTSFSPSSFNNAGIRSSFTSSFSSAAPIPDCGDDSKRYDGGLNKKENVCRSPEEKIYENLSYCPLNRFGYGIHLV